MKNTLFLIFTFCTLSSVCAQRGLQTGSTADVARKYRVSLPVITLPQLATKSWDDRTHTQHIELHIKRDLDDKNIIGLKLATWRLFQPMGIVW